MSATIATHNARNIGRCAALRKLLQAFTKKSITRCQASSILDIGESTARNYIRDLKHAGLVDVIGRADFTNTPVYGLCAGSSEIDRFMENLDAGAIPKRQEHVRAVDKRVPKDPVALPAEPRRGAFRDPLVAALFGPAEVRP